MSAKGLYLQSAILTQAMTRSSFMSVATRDNSCWLIRPAYRAESSTEAIPALIQIIHSRAWDPLPQLTELAWLGISASKDVRFYLPGQLERKPMHALKTWCAFSPWRSLGYCRFWYTNSSKPRSVRMAPSS